MDKNKHIYIVDEYLSSQQNGVGTYMTNFIECMKGLNVNVNKIIFNTKESHFSIYEDYGTHYYCFPVCNDGDMLSCGGLFWPFLKLYISDNINNIFFINHSPCVDFMKVLRREFPLSKIVFTIHDQGWTASLLGNKERLLHILSKKYPYKKNYAVEIFCKKYFEQERQMYNIADCVVCLSETTKQLLRSIYSVPPQKLHVIPNGYTTSVGINELNERERIRTQLGICPDERVLLFVGRTVKAKGLDPLLQAFERLWIRDNKLRLIVSGEVYRFNEFAKLTPRSLSHVTYTGLISKDILRLWYIASDIGVLPSYTEQCSYTGIEMMANDLLVVTTDGNGLTDMFQHMYNALIAQIKPNLSESLERVLYYAINLEKEQSLQIRKNALKIVEKKYSISVMRNGYRKLIFPESSYSTI